MDSRWYIIQVLANREKKVKKIIEENIKRSGIDYIHEVFLPTENVIDLKRGEKKVQERLIWPGYLFIKMDLNEESWQFIVGIYEVVDFLGGQKPVPLSDQEVNNILDDLHKKKENVVHKHQVQVGDPVKIIDGVFLNFPGTVVDVFQDKGRVNVLVSIFGRKTCVKDLDFEQIEKIVD